MKEVERAKKTLAPLLKECSIFGVLIALIELSNEEAARQPASNWHAMAGDLVHLVGSWIDNDEQRRIAQHRQFLEETFHVAEPLDYD